MSAHVKSAFLSLIILAASACGSAEQSSDGSSGTDSSAAVQEGLDVMSSLAGRYAHYDVVAYEDNIFGMEMLSLVVTYGFTTLEIVDGELVSVDRFCHAEMPSNLDFENIVSDEFTRAIVPESVVVSLIKEGDRWGYHRPATPTPLGIDMEDVDEPLPDATDDPRITDADGDGKPGVTAGIILPGGEPGEIYMIRKEVFAYTLYRQDNGHLVGVVEDSSEQLVIGADPEWLNVPSRPEQFADSAFSPIHLVPLAESEAVYDCDDLMRDVPTLFPSPEQFW